MDKCKKYPKRITIIALLTVAGCVVFMFFLLIPGYKTLPDWAEARAGAGTIGIMLCEYAESKGKEGNYPPSLQELLEVGALNMEVDDLFDRLYFQKECYSWEASYDETLNPPIRYVITVTAPEGRKTKHISQYKKVTYDHKDIFERYE